jgi:hypothetical protein
MVKTYKATNGKSYTLDVDDEIHAIFERRYRELRSRERSIKIKRILKCQEIVFYQQLDQQLQICLLDVNLVK